MGRPGGLVNGRRAKKIAADLPGLSVAPVATIFAIPPSTKEPSQCR